MEGRDCNQIIKLAQIYGLIFYFRVLGGLMKGCTLATAIVLMHNTTGIQGIRRVGSPYVPKCASDAPLQRPLEGSFTTIFLYEKLFHRHLLLQPVIQL